MTPPPATAVPELDDVVLVRGAATADDAAEPDAGLAYAPGPIEERHRLPVPDTVVKGRILWPYVITFAVGHAVALLAAVPWLFSWASVAVLFAGVFVFGQAITLGYHRVLTHRSATLPKWLEHFIVVLALCSLEDTPGKWVATHRFHHLESDHQDDPHSPLVAFLWAHIGWMCVWNGATHTIDTYAKYAPDILRDRFYMKLEKSYRWVWYFVAHAALYAVAGAALGWFVGGTGLEAARMAASFVVWGVFVRVVIVWHITWSVNSFTHCFGYQNHKTGDHSKNNWVVAFLASGEGWHNNHHADPASACNTHRWWEVDVTYWLIKGLERVGLAKRVIKPRHVRHAARATAAATATAAPER